MLIFQLLDQYSGIAKAAFFGCATKLNKSIKTNIIEILILIMCIPRKINFLQLGRYENTLDFVYNASLAAINITKVLIKEQELPLSIGWIKSLMVNAHFAKRFFKGAALPRT